MSKQLKGNLLILLAAFIWGTAFLAQKDGGQIGTFTFNGTRNLIGGASLLPVIFVLDRLREKAAAKAAGEASVGSVGLDPTVSAETETADLGWNKTVFVGGIMLGVILFIASSLQQYGLLFTTIGKTGFITALYSLIVPIFSVLLGKHVSKLTWLGVFIGLVGLYCMSMHGESLHLSYGDSVVLGCAFAFAIQIMMIDYFAPKVDGVKLACVEFFTVGVISLFFMFMFEDPSLEAMGIERLSLKRNMITILSNKTDRGWEIRLESEKLYYFTIEILDEQKKKTLPIPSGKCSMLIDKL